MLLQNYPNPFNPETTIEYVTQKPAFVELKIYNIGFKVSYTQDSPGIRALKIDSGIIVYIFNPRRTNDK